MKNIDNWKQVVLDTPLLKLVAKSNLDEASSMSALRKNWPVEEIAIAAQLVDARTRAKGKLDHAHTIISDSVGVQQATSSAIAAHKAERFNEKINIVDLCCGIGADLNALPQHSIGVDIDPLRCWMAKSNTGKVIVCHDATTYALPEHCIIHIDPSRRHASGRLFELDAMLPSFSEVVKISESTSGGCIKLSPAVNAEDLEQLTHPIEIEYIEENNRVVQGAIWYGSLTANSGKTTATSISRQQSFTGTPTNPSFDSTIGPWILEPNPALERAGLHGTIANQIGATEPAPGIGLLCAAQNPDSQWFTPFEVLETTPLRIEKVAAVLDDFNCTQVEVKTRGRTIDPNVWQNKLNKKSSGPLLTIFALRLGKKHVSIVARRKNNMEA